MVGLQARFHMDAIFRSSSAQEPGCWRTLAYCDLTHKMRGSTRMKNLARVLRNLP